MSFGILLSPSFWRSLPFLVIRLGFEPKTHSLEGCCSIQLSYQTILYWICEAENRTFASCTDILHAFSDCKGSTFPKTTQIYREQNSRLPHFIHKNNLNIAFLLLLCTVSFYQFRLNIMLLCPLFHEVHELHEVGVVVVSARVFLCSPDVKVILLIFGVEKERYEHDACPRNLA